MNRSIFFKLAFAATCLAFVVILLGAYTRLADAGLGCPDWPGCYGHVGVPKHADDVAVANQAYPDRPVEAAKAWKEMIHRYFASTLGLLIFAIGIIAIKKRAEPNQASRFSGHVRNVDCNNKASPNDCYVAFNGGDDNNIFIMVANITFWWAF